MRAAVALLLLAAAPAQAAPLTVKPGETWVFSVKDGQPASARKVASSAKPAKGQIVVAVRAMMGTTMIVTNRSRWFSIVRAAMIPGTAQAYPESMGMKLLPCSPTPRMNLSMMNAARAM